MRFNANIKYQMLSLFFLIFFVAGWSADVTAQHSWNNNHLIDAKLFTVKEGLSHRSVNTVIEDNRKLIWVGTRNGLNRFDGQSFKSFFTEHEIVNNRILDLYIDGDVLWCIHEEEVHNSFVNFTLFHTILEKRLTLVEHLGTNLPFEEADIRKIDVKNKALYIYLNDNKAYQYTSSRGLIPLPFVEKGEKVLAQNENGQFIIWKESIDYYLKIASPEGKILLQKSPDFLGVKLRLAYQGTGPDGGTWLSFKHKTGDEFFKIETNGNITHFNAYKAVVDQLGITKKKFSRQKSYAYLPKYDAFLYTLNEYFLMMSMEGKVLYFENSKTFNQINGIGLVQDNTFWLAAKTGLYQLEFKKNNFVNYLDNRDLKDFRAIIRQGDDLYFNSYSGVFKVKPKSNKPPVKVFKKALNSLVDQSGNLWLSDYDALIRHDLTTGKSTRFDLLDVLEIWSLFEDRHQNIWYSKKGLHYLNPKTGQSTEVNYNEFKELKKHTIYHFYKKENGQILLCATSGLYELDIEKGIVARYSSEGKEKFYLPAKDFRHLYFDENANTYWLATGSEGLIEWNAKTNQSNIYKLNRLEANTIHAVYPDEFGFLWLSTENGIIQFNRESKHFKAYLPVNGTSSHEFNRIAHFQDEDGTIYFGSINGVTSFHPKDFTNETKLNEQVQLIVVEFNQFKNTTAKIENLTSTFYQTKKVRLKAGDRFFRLTLALDNYTHNADAIYYYKLKTDKDWSKTSSNQIEMSGLPYGSHQLQIKGLLIDGQFSEVLEIPVRVLRPFYLTGWFLLLFLTSIVVITFGIIRWRTQLLTIQKTLLEEEVENRTAQIEAQAKRLKTLDETKSRFFANVSHELRTPITLIQGPIQSALNSQELGNRNYTLLAKAERNTKKLLNLVNEILDLTKLESSKLKLDESSVVFYNYLRRIISNFQSLADRKQIEFLFEYHCRKDVQLKLDQGKFEKIINNLLSNAFKFTPKNGNIHIEVNESQKSNDILISIKDNGRGIPAEDLPNIFNRFYQSSINTKAEGGLGIGLALSMEYLKLMNGKMWAESQTNGEHQGSTFYVQFPKKEVMTMLPNLIENEEVIVKHKEIQTITTKHDITRPTILLVEDNIDLQEYIQFLLAPYHHVITAENGQEALQWLEKSSTTNQLPSAIISDVMMPMVDGFELLAQLKSNPKWRTIPVVMLTARAELKDKLKALRIGVDDYLVKPFKEEELLVRIQNLIERLAIRQTHLQTVSINGKDKRSHQEIEIVNATNPMMTISKKDQDWLIEFEQLVIDQLSDSRFSVNYLAELYQITRRTLGSKIKKLTGLTTNQYIRTVRLQLAKDLLEQQECQTVTEVARRIGFQKVEYFSKLYKETFGKLPSEYL